MSAYGRINSALAGSDYAALVAEVPYAAYLGLEIQTVDGGRRYRLPYRDELIGNARIQALHGGVVAGFLEAAAIFEVLISQAQRRIPSSIDFGVDYLRSAKDRESFVDCRVVRHGRRVAQVQAEAWQTDRERPVAMARSVFLLRDV